MKRLARALPVLCLMLAAYAAPPIESTVTQSTSGPNSPAIYAPGATTVQTDVRVYQLDAAQLVRELESRAGREARAIAELLRDGRLDEALAALEASSQQAARPLAQAAYLRFAQGRVLAARGLAQSAERALAAAVAIEPSQCVYRVRWALALLVVDRVADAARALQATLPEVQACEGRGTAVVQGLLHSVRTRVAIEALDRPRAEASVAAAARAFARHVEGEVAPDVVESAFVCGFAALVKRVRLGLEQGGDGDRMAAACLRASERAAAAYNATGASARGKRSVRTPSNFGQLIAADLLISADRASELARMTELLKIARSAPRVGEIGFDEEGRRAYIGMLLANRGFELLWSDAPDAGRTRADYAEARRYLEPLATPRHPQALWNYTQLIVRARHFDEIYSASALGWDARGLFSRVVQAAGEATYEAEFLTCEALLHVERFARTDPGLRIGGQALDALQRQRLRCTEEGTQPGSQQRRQLQHTVDVLDRNEAMLDARWRDAISAADRVLDTLLAAKGFPGHAELGSELADAYLVRGRIRVELGEHRSALDDWEAAHQAAQHSRHVWESSQALEAVHGLLVAQFPDDRPGIAHQSERWFAAVQASHPERSLDCLGLMLLMRAGHARSVSLLSAGRVADGLRSLAESVEIWKKHGDCVPVRGDRPAFQQAVKLEADRRMIDQRVALDAFQIDPGTQALSVNGPRLREWISRLSAAAVPLNGQPELHLTLEAQRLAPTATE